MENKAKLQKLILAEKAELEKLVGIDLPDFQEGKDLGKLIKEDSDLSDSQTFLTLKKQSTNAALFLIRGRNAAKKALEACDEALQRLGK